MWRAGVELRGLARGQHEVAVPEDQPEFSIKDIEPFITFVRPQIRRRALMVFAGGDHLLEGLQPAGAFCQRDDRAAVIAIGAEVDPGSPVEGAPTSSSSGTP